MNVLPLKHQAFLLILPIYTQNLFSSYLPLSNSYPNLQLWLHCSCFCFLLLLLASVWYLHSCLCFPIVEQLKQAKEIDDAITITYELTFSSDCLLSPSRSCCLLKRKIFYLMYSSIDKIPVESTYFLFMFAEFLL